MPAVGLAEPCEGEHDSATNALAPLVLVLGAVVAIEEGAQQVDVIDQRAGVGQRRQQRCGRPRGGQGGLRVWLAGLGERREAIAAAEIALLRERDIKGRDRLAADFGTINLETKVRRSQQRDQCTAREAGGNAFHCHIDGRGIWLAGQRQRVESLEWHAGAVKHVTREIQVRQRPGHHQRGLLEIDGAPQAAICLQPAGHAFELFFAIAILEHEWQLAGGAGGNHHGGGRRGWRRRDFFDADKRQPQAIEVAGIERPVGRDDVDACEATDAG